MIGIAGWIKLHRCLKDKAIFENEKLLKVFIWCLLRATHSGYEQLIGRQKVWLEPGQFPTGRKKAGLELNMKSSTAWDYLKLLESNKTITINSNNKFSVITIENWAIYQSEKEETDNKPTANQQQINTNKNVKNNKDIYCAFFEDIWGAYPNKKGKGKVSDTRKKMLHKLGDEIKRCIERYISDVEERRKEFPELKYQNGSTFFNSGYVDYLDANYEEPVKRVSKTRTAEIPEGWK